MVLEDVWAKGKWLLPFARVESLGLFRTIFVRLLRNSEEN